MGSREISFLMLFLWSVGIIGINIYLSHLLESVHQSIKDYFVHFLADVGISATAGVITYLLAKTLSLPDIYLVMITAIIGHLSARVAYKSILFETIKNNDVMLKDSDLSVLPTDKSEF